MWNSPIPILLSRESSERGRHRGALALEAARPGSDLVRVCRGAYVHRAELARLTRSEAHRLRVVAARMTGALPERAVVARESAAAVQRIPLIGELPEQVQLVRPDRDGGRVTAGFRSLRAPEGYDVVEDDGVRLSSVAQTLVDLGRRRPMRSTLAGIDEALRQGRATMEEIRALAVRRPRARGNPRLLRTLRSADPLAESPGESLSRAVMIAHHLPAPRLQIKVFDQWGKLLGRVDFMWPEIGVIGEFDGMIKYTRGRSGRPIEEIVLEERRREHAIERATGMRVVRWLWEDAFRETGMLRALAEAGVKSLY